MLNKIFGEVQWDTGWETEITLWGKKHKITVAANAYYEHELITGEQEKAYLAFKEIPTSRIEELLKQFYEELVWENFYVDKDDLIKGSPSEFLTPIELVIEQEGICALLFSDKNDLDNGIAVKLYPEEEVMTQDEFL